MEDAGTALPQARVTNLVERILAKRGISRPLAADAELAGTGLTSLDMVSLMLAIEGEFDVMIPAAEITPANFHSIATIATMLVRILAKPGSS